MIVQQQCVLVVKSDLATIWQQQHPRTTVLRSTIRCYCFGPQFLCLYDWTICVVTSLDPRESEHWPILGGT